MDPVVVVPGIKGSSLEDFYPLDVATTWSTVRAVTGPNIHEIELAPNGEVDLASDVVTRAGQVFPIAYAPLVNALRGRSGAPVYLFPYDWRLSIAVNGQRLVQFVLLLLKKPISTGWTGSFHFVCHSLGGLVFRSFLTQWQPPRARPITSVVFIATPHLGSLDAIDALVRGETSLFEGRKEMRKIARGFPSVYELLPHGLAQSVVDDSGNELDIFDVSNWQANVVAQPGDVEGGVDQPHLASARAALNAMARLDDPAFALAGRVLNVYGIRPASTLRKVEVLRSDPRCANWYDLDNATKTDGDEVVPVESAKLANTPAVGIPFDDVKYISDWTARFVSFHAFLPTLDEVQTIVARFQEGMTRTDLLPIGLQGAAVVS